MNSLTPLDKLLMREKNEKCLKVVCQTQQELQSRTGIYQNIALLSKYFHMCQNMLYSRCLFVELSLTYFCMTTYFDTLVMHEGPDVLLDKISLKKCLFDLLA